MSLRVSNSPDADKDSAAAVVENKLLWSRRLNRAVLTLGKDPEEWGADVASAEERLLWSRRLARAVKILYTDPDLVPLDKLWTRGGQQQSPHSSASMLQMGEHCDLENDKDGEQAIKVGTIEVDRSLEDADLQEA